MFHRNTPTFLLWCKDLQTWDSLPLGSSLAPCSSGTGTLEPAVKLHESVGTDAIIVAPKTQDLNFEK